MDFEQFKKECVSFIKKTYGEEVEVKIFNVTKNNGMELTGLNIVEGKSNISPTIYIDSYYDDYLHGKAISEICRMIIGLHKKSCKVSFPDYDTLTNYEMLKDTLYPRIINCEKNRKMLADCPYVELMDLAVVFYFIVNVPGVGRGDVLVSNSLLEEWKVNKEDIYNTALYNMRKNADAQILSMDDVLLEMLRSDKNKDDLAVIEKLIVDEKNNDGFFPLLILTNKTRSYGAASILLIEKLEELAERFNDDLIIIPSSIHETIVLAKNNVPDMSLIVEMVNEINVIHVAPSEVLSDHIYCFERTTGSLKIAVY